jgi:hypothetical protein
MMASCLRFCLDKSISSDTDEAADSGGDLKYKLAYILVHKKEIEIKAIISNNYQKNNV